MSDENQKLLLKISQLAGQINRHKNQEAGEGYSAYSSYSAPPTRGYPYTRGASRGRSSYRGYRGSHPYARGGYRGRGGYAPTIHRNKTLILNGSSDDSNENSHTDEFGDKWVAKTDRHMQLINASVYEKESETRKKAIELSKAIKLQKREQIEKAKLARYMQHTSGTHGHPGYPQTVVAGGATTQRQLTIDGIRYLMTNNGGKLVKLSGETRSRTHSLISRLTKAEDKNAPTPKKVVVAGITFVRSKGGNLWRLGHIKMKKGTLPQRHKLAKRCKYFTSTGKCKNGNTCPYTHDPSKVAICPLFMQNKCDEGEACDLSHEPNAHRVSSCRFFLQGTCTNDKCLYTHIRVNPSAPVCRDFATEGYCDKGEDCEKRHVQECPDFDEHGVCERKGCKLPHIERAGRRRAAAAAAKKREENSDNNEDDDDDMFSSDEERDNEDDIDSDGLEDDEPEYIAPVTDVKNEDVSNNLDFIAL